MKSISTINAANRKIVCKGSGLRKAPCLQQLLFVLLCICRIFVCLSILLFETRNKLSEHQASALVVFSSSFARAKLWKVVQKYCQYLGNSCHAVDYSNVLRRMEMEFISKDFTNKASYLKWIQQCSSPLTARLAGLLKYQMYALVLRLDI